MDLRTHYVPRHYLRGFSRFDGERLIIWAFEKEGGRGFATQPENIALETDFYPENVEAYLANVVEEPSRQILETIREERSFAASDKEEFSRYTLAMIRRVPRHRERLHMEILPDAQARTFEAWRGLLQRERDLGHLSEYMYDFRMRELEELEQNWGVELPDELKPENRAPAISTDVVSLLASMNWTFVTTEGPIRFLTGDNPVFYTEALGMSKPNSELMFPLSPEVALWMKRGWHSPDCEFRRAKQFLVRETNKRTILSASQFVYYDENARWISKLLTKKRLRPQRLPGRDSGLYMSRDQR